MKKSTIEGREIVLLYANDKLIDEMDIKWDELLTVIRKTVSIMHSGDYSQPIKPYLRYKNFANRIIAMPAYVGGDICIAGIKWISSFPDNINNGVPRAHCIIVLNDSVTGVPLAVFNSAKISAIRTASVSGTIIEEYIKRRGKHQKVGIIGWGPIGKCHFRLINEQFKDFIDHIQIYDIKSDLNLEVESCERRISTSVSDSWEKLYNDSDIIITCTVAKSPYIDLKPKSHALLLNVSLRDYKPLVYKWVKNSIIVDDWDEVCRENTDIENMHKKFGLLKTDTLDLYDVLIDTKMDRIISRPIMFNPMGLAVFDLAVSSYYYKRIRSLGKGEEI